MKKYSVELPQEVELFYLKIAENANFPIERVLSDCLIKYAGELTERAMRHGQD